MPQNNTRSLGAITSRTVRPAAASTSARVGRLGSFLISFSSGEDRLAVILSAAGAKDLLLNADPSLRAERPVNRAGGLSQSWTNYDRAGQSTGRSNARQNRRRNQRRSGGRLDHASFALTDSTKSCISFFAWPLLP